jgi:hypothetical protein
MTLAVASTSEVRDNPYDGTVVVTKPTGVSVGDLLVIVAATITEVPSVTSTGFTESFAFGHDAGGANRDVGFSFLWRIADSSDVSASNYTVTGDVFAAYMFRITGWTSGEPVFTNGQYETSRQTGTAGTITGTPNLAVPTEQLLIVGFGSADETYTTYTTPAVSPSNPSWTLLSNFQAENSGGTKRSSSRVAYATRTQTTNITSFSITADQDNSDTNSQIGFVACICTPQNATASNAVFQNDSEFFSPLTASTQEPNNDFQEISPEFFSPTVRATMPTQWVNEDKPTTEWINE